MKSLTETRRTMVWLPTRSAFLNRVMQAGFGSVGAQIVTLAALPLLARVYHAAEFGAYGVYVSSLNAIITVVCLRLDIAVAIPASRRSAAAVAYCAVLIALCFSAAIFAVAKIGGLCVPRWRDSFIYPYIGLLSISAATAGVNNVAINLLARTHAYLAISAVRGVQPVVMVACSLVLAKAQWCNGLIVGSASGLAVSTVVAIFIAFRLRLIALPFSHVRPRLMRNVLHRHRAMIVFNTPQAVVDSVRTLLPMLAVQRFFGPSAAGLFHIANQLIGIPLRTAAQAISQVFLRYLCDVSLIQEALTIFRSFVIFSICGAVFLYGVLFTCGDPLLATLLGKNWFGITPVIEVVALGYIANFICTPISFVFHPARRQQEFLGWAVIFAVVPIAAFGLQLSRGGSLLSCMLFFSTSVATVCVVQTLRCIEIARRHIQQKLGSKTTLTT